MMSHLPVPVNQTLSPRYIEVNAAIMSHLDLGCRLTSFPTLHVVEFGPDKSIVIALTYVCVYSFLGH